MLRFLKMLWMRADFWEPENGTSHKSHKYNLHTILHTQYTRNIYSNVQWQNQITMKITAANTHARTHTHLTTKQMKTKNKRKKNTHKIKMDYQIFFLGVWMAVCFVWPFKTKQKYSCTRVSFSRQPPMHSHSHASSQTICHPHSSANRMAIHSSIRMASNHQAAVRFPYSRG